jgi:hypothetical protein
MTVFSRVCRPLRHTGVFLVAIPLLLTGCSRFGEGNEGSADAENSVPDVSATPVLQSANDKPLPLDAYLLTGDQLEVLTKAQNSLVSQCMKRFGLTYSLPSVTGQLNDDGPKTRIDGRYGPQNAQRAAQWGYHPEGGAPKRDGVPWGKPGGQETPEAMTALRGTSDKAKKYGPGGQKINGRKVPDHGCLGEAARTLTGKADGSIGDHQLAIDLKFQTLERSLQDERTQAVFRKWSACMKERGFSYKDPLDALGDKAWSKTPMPTQREIQVATADSECRKEHNVVGVWYAVDYAYQEQAVDKNAEVLDSVGKSIEARMKAAAQAS